MDVTVDGITSHSQAIISGYRGIRGVPKVRSQSPIQLIHYSFVEIDLYIRRPDLGNNSYINPVFWEFANVDK